MMLTSRSALRAIRCFSSKSKLSPEEFLRSPDSMSTQEREEIENREFAKKVSQMGRGFSVEDVEFPSQAEAPADRGPGVDFSNLLQGKSNALPKTEVKDDDGFKFTSKELKELYGLLVDVPTSSKPQFVQDYFAKHGKQVDHALAMELSIVFAFPVVTTMPNGDKYGDWS